MNHSAPAQVPFNRSSSEFIPSLKLLELKEYFLIGICLMGIMVIRVFYFWSLVFLGWLGFNNNFLLKKIFLQIFDPKANPPRILGHGFEPAYGQLISFRDW